MSCPCRCKQPLAGDFDWQAILDDVLKNLPQPTTPTPQPTPVPSPVPNVPDPTPEPTPSPTTPAGIAVVIKNAGDATTFQTRRANLLADAYVAKLGGIYPTATAYVIPEQGLAAITEHAKFFYQLSIERVKSANDPFTTITESKSPMLWIGLALLALFLLRGK